MPVTARQDLGREQPNSREVGAAVSVGRRGGMRRRRLNSVPGPPSSAIHSERPLSLRVGFSKIPDGACRVSTPTAVGIPQWNQASGGYRAVCLELSRRGHLNATEKEVQVIQVLVENAGKRELSRIHLERFILSH